MKYIGKAMLLAVCFLPACARNLETSTPLKISARVEGGDTRTSLESDNSVSFAEGDCLAVFGGDGKSKCFTASTVYEDGSADFSGSVTPASSYIAVYPYSDKCIYYDDDVIINIPDVQKAVAGSFDPAAAISAGRTESLASGTHLLDLKNVCALLKFSVPEGQSYSTAIILSTGNPLCGEMRCSVGDEPSLTPTGEDFLSTVTLQGDIEGGKWYYIAVNPTTLTYGFALYLFDKQVYPEDLEYYSTVKSTDKTVSLYRSQILNLGIIGAEPGAAFEAIDGEITFEW